MLFLVCCSPGMSLWVLYTRMCPCSVWELYEPLEKYQQQLLLRGTSLSRNKVMVVNFTMFQSAVFRFLFFVLCLWKEKTSLDKWWFQKCNKFWAFLDSSEGLPVNVSLKLISLISLSCNACLEPFLPRLDFRLWWR